MSNTFLLAGIGRILLSLCLVSESPADTLKINTSSLGADVIGFNGPTPVEISVYKGVITSIKPLPNNESPRYLQFVEESGLFRKLLGKTIDEARAIPLDAVSGATYTSEALIRNIEMGLAAAGEKQ